MSFRPDVQISDADNSINGFSIGINLHFTEGRRNSCVGITHQYCQEPESNF
jgi:hypothetical protein